MFDPSTVVATHLVLGYAFDRERERTREATRACVVSADDGAIDRWIDRTVATDRIAQLTLMS